MSYEAVKDPNRLRNAVGFAGGITDAASGWRPTLRRLLFAPDGALSRSVVLCLAGLFTLPTALYFWKYEGGAANLFFVSSVTLTLAACMLLAFRRVLVASVLVNALVGIAATVAWAKHQAMDMVLHAYDIVFYLSSWSTIAYLWRDFQLHVIALVAARAGHRRCRCRRLSVRCQQRAPQDCARRGCPSRVRLRHRRRGEGRAPAHPVLLERSLHVVVLFILGRDGRNTVARPIDRSGQFGARRSFCDADGLRHHDKASAHHPHP